MLGGQLNMLAGYVPSTVICVYSYIGLGHNPKAHDHCLALHIKLQCFLTAGSVLFTHLFDRIEDIDLCRH